jgi:hypothetical protein
MPYPDDLEGKYIDFHLGLDLVGATSAEGKTFDENGLLPDETIGKEVKVYRDETPGNAVRTLVPEDLEWDFNFLKYIEGVVTIASLVWGPILTGPMSGCRLCSYRDRGRQMFAHIGTGSPASQKTVDVKSDWRDFIDTLQPLSVMGFDPFNRFTTAEIAAQQLLAVPHIMGYFDGKSAYAMVLAQIPESMHTLMGDNGEKKKISKVGRVERVELLPWSQLDWPEASSGGRRQRSAIRHPWATIKSAFPSFK